MVGKNCGQGRDMMLRGLAGERREREGERERERERERLDMKRVDLNFA